MPVVKKIKSVKVHARARRKVSIRKKLAGTAERPRLSVFRSAKHIYVQAVDDTSNTVLAAASDLEEDFKAEGKKKDKAKEVGKALARKLLAKNISLCVFDRNGFIYHGRVSAVADGAREGGLKF
jgi:large subunit ribosomal protein L18